MSKKPLPAHDIGSGNIFADLGLPDLSNVMRGRFRGYSTERLMRMLTAFGQDIDITVRPRRGKSKAGGVDGNKLTIAFDRAGEKRVVDSFVERA